jgi:rare lipoprotein A
MKQSSNRTSRALGGRAGRSSRAASASLVLIALVLILSAGCTTQKRLAERGKKGFRQQGIASWYGPGFHGKLAANGEVYDMHALTAAHKQLPFETMVEVHNRENGRKVRVRITDRGPFVRGRIIDLSRAAAEEIGMLQSGVAKVTLTVVAAGSGRSVRSGKSARWLIQAGAFRDRPRAEKHLGKVRKVDGRARLDDNDGLLKVLIGPIAREKEARRVFAALEARQIEAILRRLP